MQRLRNPDEAQWTAHILSNRNVLSASQSSNSSVILKLDSSRQENKAGKDYLEVDYVFTATGYRRNAHEEMLSDLKSLLSNSLEGSEMLPVRRDYRVEYDEAKIDGDRAGVWLQGCNEETHGVS